MMRRSQRLRDWLQICKYADIPSSAAPLAPMNPAFMLSIFAKTLYVPDAPLKTPSVDFNFCTSSQFAPVSLVNRPRQAHVKAKREGRGRWRQPHTPARRAASGLRRARQGRGKVIIAEIMLAIICILVLKNNVTGNPGARRRD
jgi:hypothetical protein